MSDAKEMFWAKVKIIRKYYMHSLTDSMTETLYAADRIDALEKELAPLEGRSVLDTVKYVAHLEKRVMELVNICAEHDVPEEALL